ncbi:MAG: prephenate dehydratase [Candidatus Nitrohelix vancouverensis]|uniref:Bifunctional chorismate mutase/prephenate dehydratase n=1 Tax=Candidatus Nitrohelix vancouverensis TaxID=2705534 RepID=A0A7T0C0W5_9BACT|nr:MAG: prephenate dehydratase [Candidatus Nitrohelix vancouverensis]
MRPIDVYRDKIDKIDDQLLKLINRRAALAVQIGKEKSRQNAKIHFHVPHREREIIERLKQANTGPFSDETIELVFRELFSATLALEKPLRISFLGPEATFTHQASVKHFGHSSTFLSAPNIESIFSDVENGKSDYGVVPVENSIEGAVNVTLDCFAESPLLICDEVNLKISHYLLSSASDIKSVKTIYSHPQPLGQCRQWLNRNLPLAAHEITSSTASAAKTVRGKKSVAAIAGKLASDLYGLNILAENLQDSADNTTRFWVIGKEPAKAAKRNKTSIVFSIKDEAGSLLHTLQLFAKNSINLSKIQSRPLRNRPWEYLFYVDLEGHQDEELIGKTLKTLAKKCLFFRILGSYPNRG